MTQNDLITLGQHAVYTTIMAAIPILGVGLIVGLLVSIFQATTQINDQTLVFVPKIISVLLMVIISGPWIINLIIDYTNNLFAQINNFVR